MAKISIFKELGGVKLGEGTGPFDKKAKTAAIHAWTEKAGLKAQTAYALAIDGKDYADAICTAVATVPPFATFTDVE